MATTKDAYIPALVRVDTVDEAVAELAEAGENGEPIAGATFTMLAPLHRRPTKGTYVAVGAIEELLEIQDGDGETSIGASVTHMRLAQLGDDLAVLAEAATGAPLAVRNVATLAGNVCADPYPGADLVPALLALDAELEIASSSGRARVPLADFQPAAGSLVTRAVVARRPTARSTFERLMVRGGGEEALASVALWVDLANDGAVAEARVAFGSVEARARRCPQAEGILVGARLSEERATEAGRAAAEAAEPIDAPDGPGWYRRQVMPAVLARAVGRLAATT